jgi:hypothetical protein
MSFNDPGFLFNNRQTDNEREAERREWEHRKEVAKRCYSRATWLVLLTMVFVAAPTGLEKWHWHVVIAVGGLIAILALIMIMKGAVKNAMISLLFASIILPGWITAAPKVVAITREQVGIVVKQWKQVL